MKKMGEVWTLAKEAMLEKDHPITLLWVEMKLQENHDLKLHQTPFIESILKKHPTKPPKPVTTVQMEALPTEPEELTVSRLKTLQSFSGEFNWLATQTRPDLSYFASLIAPACSKYAAWSEHLV